MRENYTLTRLFLEADLFQGDDIYLSREQAHYLGSVLRRVKGTSIRVFNGRDGEWRAETVSYTHLTLPTTPYV